MNDFFAAIPDVYDLEWIPATGNACERLFHAEKIDVDNLDRLTRTKHADIMLYLLLNRSLWSIDDVAEVYDDNGN